MRRKAMRRGQCGPESQRVCTASMALVEVREGGGGRTCLTCLDHRFSREWSMIVGVGGGEEAPRRHRKKSALRSRRVTDDLSGAISVTQTRSEPPVPCASRVITSFGEGAKVCTSIPTPRGRMLHMSPAHPHRTAAHIPPLPPHALSIPHTHFHTTAFTKHDQVHYIKSINRPMPPPPLRSPTDARCFVRDPETQSCRFPSSASKAHSAPCLPLV